MLGIAPGFIACKVQGGIGKGEVGLGSWQPRRCLLCPCKDNNGSTEVGGSVKKSRNDPQKQTQCLITARDETFVCYGTDSPWQESLGQHRAADRFNFSLTFIVLVPHS